MKYENFKVFLYGSYRNNTGPDNVNKNLIENSQHKFLYEKLTGKISKRLERFLYLIQSDVIVFSGFGQHKFWVAIAKIFKKKIIYLMHGCALYETKINKLKLKKKTLDYEKKFFKLVDLILPVSEQYKNWFVEYFPEYKNKTHYLNLGIQEKENVYYKKNKAMKEKNDKKIRIIVAGGDRIQKNNIEVCKAIEMLANNLENNIELKICGRKYSQKNLFEKYRHSVYVGMLPHKEFCKELKKSDIFILNSEVESFGLSVVDALLCGCSVLISKNSGIISILDLREEDLISDVHNPIEIAEKIKILLDKRNSKRILSAIDFEHYTWKQVSERLYKICFALYIGKDYEKIK